MEGSRGRRQTGHLGPDSLTYVSEVPRGPRLWLHESQERAVPEERTVMMLKSPPRDSSSALPALPGSYRVFASEFSPGRPDQHP